MNFYKNIICCLALAAFTVFPTYSLAKSATPSCAQYEKNDKWFKELNRRIKEDLKPKIKQQEEIIKRANADIAEVYRQSRQQSKGCRGRHISGNPCLKKIFEAADKKVKEIREKLDKGPVDEIRRAKDDIKDYQESMSEIRALLKHNGTCK